MNIGLFSGSFNPIHLGHLILASYCVEYGAFDEVWLSVSPHNPLRERVAADDDAHRCAMVQMAVSDLPRVKYCDIEFSLPQPSYTIATLDALRERYPEHNFTLIIGADNWLIFDRWSQWQRIISDYSVCIYPRTGYAIDTQTLPERVGYIDAPLVELSSTWVREGVAAGRNMTAFLPYGVYRYIVENNLYKLK